MASSFDSSEPYPLPGEILTLDCRRTHGAAEVMDELARPLRVVQWNVERNYEADAVLEELRRLDADVYFLQEIDIGCTRSGGRDHFTELCEGLECLGGFVCEFEELDSPLRSAAHAGGGVHGNAILTRFPATFRGLQHLPEAFDWEKRGASLGEPRKGSRYACVASIDVPWMDKPILGYSVHLEVFCGIVGRVGEFSSLMQDAHEHAGTHPHQLIFGDLNTMAHSIARLSPRFAQDRYRFLSLGWVESAWWHTHVLGFHVEDGPVNTLLGRGWSEEVASRVRNDGFWDPWDPVEDITICPKAYRGMFSGKLDWTLLRGWEVRNKDMGNDAYALSDHRWLMVEVVPDRVSGDAGALAQWRDRRILRRSNTRRGYGLSLWGLAGQGLLVAGVEFHRI
ncbi:Endonuclease/exonuclease/phosphatase [Piptocephalis cylindrospora]|uniref:Endonuclease/exonuclease/phosphatase n=1 Tax=Piptocephalis cylindrospora TaxID=1907219 RepID=A0A4P9Y581_9FUNG|nr:Endonuclease/exonuclease/phosphatase [Piptocephalis cylindrospora]|eukprot:RKP13974.1 Endonuclease/exonuclease/phosphatase [Piptocephalis cylindrospora]